MNAKKNYYDIESEYGDVLNGNGAESFTFLDWLRFAQTHGIEAAKRRELETRVIENFIKNAPKIKPVGKSGESEYVPEVPEVDKRLPEAEEIISETLARIYAEQGLFSKAKEIYKKLSLINPEKSNYFAALIKELKKQESDLKK